MADVKNPIRLAFLADLRSTKEDKYTHKDMAQYFGFTGTHAHQTVGRWERGESIPPQKKYRSRFIDYLWNVLSLRRYPTQFEENWQILVEEWQWSPLDENERRRLKLDSSSDEIDVVPPPHRPDQTSSYTRHFVGRDQEIREIIALLAPQFLAQTNVVAIVGMAGVGKTTLAACIAHRLKEQFQDGVLWARVSTDNPLDILQSWAQAYDYDFNTISSLESRAAAVRNMLSDKQTLIVLDDVGSLEVGRLLLPSGSGCSILITTRNQDIAIALNAYCFDLPELTIDQSLELLTNTLGADRVGEENEAAHTICEFLDHLPLAVEIIAQRLASRPRQKLAAIAERLRAASFRLDLRISDRAVRTSFLVSWDNLDVEQRRIFTLIGVFEGRSFSVEALAHVADLEPTLMPETLMDLAALSLVGEDGERYRQHLLLVDFAREKLTEAESIDEAIPALRMAEYFLTLTQENQTNYAVFDSELESIMFGMGTAHRLGEWQLVLDYADSLTEPWFTRAEYARARQGFEWAVESTKALGRLDREARFLCNLGTAYVEQSDYDRADGILTQSLQIGYREEIEDVIADVQFQRATILIERSNYQEAEKLLSESEEIRTRLGNVSGNSDIIYWQGFIAYQSEKLELAHTYCREAIGIQEREKDNLGLIRTYRLLADISSRNNDIDDALNHNQRALNLAQELQDQGEYAASLYGLGKSYRRLGDLERSEKILEKCLELFQKMDSRRYMAFTQFELGLIKRARNELATAVDYLQQSVSQIRILQDQFNLVVMLHLLATLEEQVSNINTVRKTCQEAIDIARRINHPDLDKLTSYLQKLD